MKKNVINIKSDFNDNLTLDKVILIIYMTYKCNFKCMYCYEQNRMYDVSLKNKEININCLKIFLDNYKEISNKDMVICLLGGEPTLHSKFLDVMKLFNKYDFIKIVNLISNGSANIDLYKKSYEILKDKFYLTISYHIHNLLGEDYYLSLFEKLNIYDNFQISFMINDVISLEENKRLLNLFNKYKPYLILLFPKKYKTDFSTFIHSYCQKYNQIIKVIYNDKSEEIIDSLDYHENFNNIFKGCVCESFKRYWVLNRRMNFELITHCSSLYNEDNSVNPIFKKKLKEFINYVEKIDILCKEDYCQIGCFLHNFKRNYSDE